MKKTVGIAVLFFIALGAAVFTFSHAGEVFAQSALRFTGPTSSQPLALSADDSLLLVANPDNNTIGNRPSVDLTTTTDPALQGAQIYRYITFSVDFRNMGVGD